MTQYILTILFGSAIGYITNWIAVKMLFRPRRAHYLWGHRVPFTPGLIPKERGRLAASIGETVSQYLMSAEVLSQTLLSEAMQTRIGSAIDRQLWQWMHDETPLAERLSVVVGPDLVNSTRQSAVSGLTQQLTASLMRDGLGQQIASMAMNHAMQKMQGGMLGFLHVDKVFEPMRQQAERLLASHIDEMLHAHAPEMVGQMVEQGAERLLQTPVKTLLDGHEAQMAKVRDTLVGLYCRTIEQQLPTMLTSLDVGRMVEDRINQMEIGQLERLILEVMDKELHAIVLLGLALGFLMGCLNCFFL